MDYKCINVGMLGVNCYIVYKGNTGVIIDPGAEENKILNEVLSSGLNIKGILLTHGHFDHVGATKYLSEKLKAPIYMHKADEYMVLDSANNLSALMGMPDFESFTPTNYIQNGDELLFDDIKITAYLTPGHTSGSLTFVCENLIFSGDTLFKDTIGRCDFPTGSFEEMMISLKRVYKNFPDNMLLLPGHNQASTIGTEKRFNPYMLNI